MAVTDTGCLLLSAFSNRDCRRPKRESAARRAYFASTESARAVLAATKTALLFGS